MSTSEQVSGGLRVTRRCRRTRHMVSIYDGEPAGMDTYGGRWQTVCEEHGWIISHSTYRLAAHWLSAADEWCGDCQEEQQ